MRILAVLGTLVIVFGIGAGVRLYSKDNATTQEVVASPTPSSTPITSFSYQGEEGKTALATLQSKATVELKHFSFGDQVISINGSASTDSLFWSFYINGTAASVGAGDYIAKSTDQIVWKLESMQ